MTAGGEEESSETLTPEQKDGFIPTFTGANR